MSQNIESSIKDGKNKNVVKCKLCGSKILEIESGVLVEKSIDLPLAKQKSASVNPESEEIKHFFLVKDMYTFENIGFSHNVNNLKYLTCADCEVGPVGYQNIDSKECYIALSRVEC